MCGYKNNEQKTNIIWSGSEQYTQYNYFYPILIVTDGTKEFLAQRNAIISWDDSYKIENLDISDYKINFISCFEKYIIFSTIDEVSHTNIFSRVNYTYTSHIYLLNILTREKVRIASYDEKVFKMMVIDRTIFISMHYGQKIDIYRIDEDYKVKLMQTPLELSPAYDYDIILTTNRGIILKLSLIMHKFASETNDLFLIDFDGNKTRLEELIMFDNFKLNDKFMSTFAEKLKSEYDYDYMFISKFYELIYEFAVKIDFTNEYILFVKDGDVIKCTLNGEYCIIKEHAQIIYDYCTGELIDSIMIMKVLSDDGSILLGKRNQSHLGILFINDSNEFVWRELQTEDEGSNIDRIKFVNGLCYYAVRSFSREDSWVYYSFDFKAKRSKKIMRSWDW